MYSMYQIPSPYGSMVPVQLPLVPGPMGMTPMHAVHNQQQQQRGGANRGQQQQQQPFQGVCLFVFNLPQDTDHNMLRQLFSAHGTVTSVRVMRNPDGRCRGFGFVNMSTMDEALRAISAINGMPLMGKTLQVSLKTDKPQQSSAAPADVAAPSV